MVRSFPIRWFVSCNRGSFFSLTVSMTKIFFFFLKSSSISSDATCYLLNNLRQSSWLPLSKKQFFTFWIINNLMTWKIHERFLFLNVSASFSPPLPDSIFLTAIRLPPTANFGPLSRGQPHPPNINHCVFTCSTRRSSGAS